MNVSAMSLLSLSATSAMALANASTSTGLSATSRARPKALAASATLLKSPFTLPSRTSLRRLAASLLRSRVSLNLLKVSWASPACACMSRFNVASDIGSLPGTNFCAIKSSPREGCPCNKANPLWSPKLARRLLGHQVVQIQNRKFVDLRNRVLGYVFKLHGFCRPQVAEEFFGMVLQQRLSAPAPFF